MDNELSVKKASKLLSAAVLGVEAYVVEVESHLAVNEPELCPEGSSKRSPKPLELRRLEFLALRK